MCGLVSPTRGPQFARVAVAVALAGLVFVPACQAVESADTSPSDLAFVDDESADNGTDAGQGLQSPSTTAPTTTTTAPPVPLGSPDQPFVPLPSEPTVRAIRTPTDIVLPVLGERENSWKVMTACEDINFIPKGEVAVVPRSHIVLDPGHGGTEPGAVGDEGTTEKQLNLQVALETARLLSAQGAQVTLTRSADHNLTTGFRGMLAKSIDPALFVSIHHNGGAPRSGSQPGTIVFTKTDDVESRRFGGLFYQSLDATLSTAAAAKVEAHAAYMVELERYEASVDAYDQSVKARDEALLANGMITETTIPSPAPAPVDGLILPRERNPIPTTTRPPPTVAPTPASESTTSTTSAASSTNSAVEGSEQTTTVPTTATTVAQTVTTVPVPDTLQVPEPFALEPVRAFEFAGAGNRGVRSWTRADGKDYLSVLRHSGDVPAVLAEFLYLTNPSEEELLMDPAFISAEAAALADAIVSYFADPDAAGTGFVDDQFDDQPIGGGGRPSGCVEPDYGL